MPNLLNDLRFALRSFARTPGFTAVVIATLALGIGANTALWSVVDRVLLRPLPFPEPQRLVAVWEDHTLRKVEREWLSAANFYDFQAGCRSCERMAAFTPTSFNLTGGGEPERVTGMRVSGEMFALLGVPPQLGRAFEPGDDRPGARPVALLSHEIWRRRFGADSGVLGRALQVDGQPVVVVGVLPPGFEFTQAGVDVWMPLAFSAEQRANRGNHSLMAVARLAPGATREKGEAELDLLGQRLEAQFPDQNTGVRATLVPLAEELVGQVRPALLVLAGAVGLVLLIACGNVASLLLARAAGRGREIAVRLALGAGRGRLVRQLLAEGLVLAVAGGVVGTALAVWGVRLLLALAPEGLPRVSEAAGATGIDARALLIALAVTVVTGLLLGLAPAVQTARSAGDALRSGRGAVGTGARLRGALVVAEVALALVLLAGAGLLLRSFERLRAVELGFAADGVLTARIELPKGLAEDPVQRDALLDRVLERVEALPGVQSAGLITHLPLTFEGNSTVVLPEGWPQPRPGEEHVAFFRTVSPRYFETLGIPLLAGRSFDGRDRGGAPRTIMINQTLARRLWPKGDPLGRRLLFDGDPHTIIGVAGDTRQGSLAKPPGAEVYVVYPQVYPVFFYAPGTLVVRTAPASADRPATDPTALASALRAAVRQAAPDLPFSQVRTMAEVVGGAEASHRFQTLLLGTFAAAAVGLAALGLYGLLAWTVAQRRREIGVRMALGAGRGAVVRQVVGRGLRLAALGTVLGLAGALAVSRLLSRLLYETSANDPAVLVATALLLTGVAAAASWIPARRAARLDPGIALKED